MTATGIAECWGIPGLTRGIDSCPGLWLREPLMGVEAHVLPLERKRGVAALGLTSDRHDGVYGIEPNLASESPEELSAIP